MTEQWLSIVEYAKKHDISDMTVRRRIRAGKVDAELREGKYFIRVPGVGEVGGSEAPRAASPVRPEPKSTIRTGDRHLEQLLERDSGVRGPQLQDIQEPRQLSYRPSAEQGYKRPAPPPIPVTAAPRAPTAPASPPQDPKVQRPVSDRRQGDRRHRGNDRRGDQGEWSYPELDLSSTHSPAVGVLPSTSNVEVQLNQLSAKLDHLAQPWQQELVASLKSEIALKDEKIGQLNQKIADLELIIKTLDEAR